MPGAGAGAPVSGQPIISPETDAGSVRPMPKRATGETAFRLPFSVRAVTRHQHCVRAVSGSPS